MSERSVTRRFVEKRFSVARRSAFPWEREVWVRNTAVVCCMVRCMESRREEVGVFPEEEVRMVSISLMESRPMVEGAEWCAADGGWLDEMW
jgi:hypothetical protein